MKDFDNELGVWKRTAALLCTLPTIVLFAVGVTSDALAFSVYNCILVVFAVLDLKSHSQVMLLWAYLVAMMFASLLFTSISTEGIFWPLLLIHTLSYIGVAFVVIAMFMLVAWIKGTK